MMDVGVVVIGRNEGERLRACLGSIRAYAGPSQPLVYVDSGSTDDSVALARSMDVLTHELTTDRPFSAARARNEGVDALVQHYPALRYVQFVDGDCTLLRGWLKAAYGALEADAQRAVVIGNLIERHADVSIYNHLCALEWRSPPGDLKDFGHLGGLSMMRLDVLRQLGGFNSDVIAGEDSELGVRIGLAGYKVTKIDKPMATHDADITRFGQWWQRSVRAGHAIAQRAYLNGGSKLRDCIKERNSTLFWGVGLPLLIVISAVPSGGWGLLLLAAYLLLAAKVVRFRLRHGERINDAMLYARYVVLAKFANGVGLMRFYVNRWNERYRIIEYK